MKEGSEGRKVDMELWEKEKVGRTSKMEQMKEKPNKE